MLARLATLLSERDRQREIARLRDEWTVQLLTLTSTASGLARAEYEERAGIPVYDPPPQSAARLLRCPVCDRRFVGERLSRRFCSKACRERHRYWTSPSFRARKNAYNRARDHAVRRARRAA